MATFARAGLAGLLLGIVGCGGAPSMMEVDMAPSPVHLEGRRLASGGMRVVGMTRDDRALIADDARGLVAVPLDGGEAIVIDPASEWVEVAGPLVLSWSRTGGGYGNLVAWRAPGPPVRLGEAARIRPFAVSDDGAWILYGQHREDRGVDLVTVAADGGSRHETPGFSNACPIAMGWAGGRFLASGCDGGNIAELRAIDPATGAVVKLLPQADFFAPLPDGKRVLAAHGTSAWIVPIDGGLPDTFPDAVSDGAFLPDGDTFVYRTSYGALRRTSISHVAPVALVASGVRTIRQLSPDGAHLVYAANDRTGSGYSDLHLVATTAPASPVTLVADLAGALFGDAFTSDGSHVLFEDGCNDAYVGRFLSRPVADGAATPRGASAWIVHAAQGARVVWNDHYERAAQRQGRADLFTGDVSGGAAPTLIATRADLYFQVSSARDRVAYTYSATPGMEGLYVADLR